MPSRTAMNNMDLLLIPLRNMIVKETMVSIHYLIKISPGITIGKKLNIIQEKLLH